MVWNWVAAASTNEAVQVQWEARKQCWAAGWFEGQVESYSVPRSKYKVLYPDNTFEWHSLGAGLQEFRTV